MGLEATVTVPIPQTGRGKISCAVKGHTVELLAQVPEGFESVAYGTKTLILEVKDGVATVEPTVD